MDEDPIFLGFGAFETTALLTSVIVAAYSLISNPTGRQSSSDRAEYQVYAGWRLALIFICLQILLMVIVIVQQSRATQVQTAAKGWLIGLMVAPWAPVAGNVRDTLTALPRVRRLMRNRLTRNELTAIMRDRFKFGQRGIALPIIIYHVNNTKPPHPLQALRANAALAPYEPELREQATAAAQVNEPHSLELGALWTINQSLQPTSIPRWQLNAWRMVSSIDLLARVWTKASFQLEVDAMPEEKTEQRRALYLDVADMLQQGGTISDDLMERGLERFCPRCQLATRCAVESFLESSERGHTDLRAAKWLKNVGMSWQGNFERVIDVMWEACFMDAKALKVDGVDEKDGVKDTSPDFDDRSKVTTTKTFALLFLIVRSLMNTGSEPAAYRTVAAIVRDGPYNRTWWDRYWKQVANLVITRQEKTAVGANDGIKIDEKVRADFKRALRDVVDEDMKGIVEEFLKDPIEDSVCGDKECFLNVAIVVPKKYKDGKVVARGAK